MSPEAAMRLRCEECGHEWSARNTEGKGRQCSKCRSRRLAEVLEIVNDGARPEVEAPVEQKDMRLLKLKDDLDIRQKMKELELAKLDRQIQEARGGPSIDTLAERLVINNIMVLDELLNSGAINLSTHQRLASSCPWCGVSEDKGLSYEENTNGHPGQNGYRCASCGHWVPYR